MRAAPPLARQSPQCVFRRVSPESWLNITITACWCFSPDPPIHSGSIMSGLPVPPLAFTAVQLLHRPMKQVYTSGGSSLVKEGVCRPLGQQITARNNDVHVHIGRISFKKDSRSISCFKSVENKHGWIQTYTFTRLQCLKLVLKANIKLHRDKIVNKTNIFESSYLFHLHTCLSFGY